jgi:signal transduction histidine kinase
MKNLETLEHVVFIVGRRQAIVRSCQNIETTFQHEFRYVKLKFTQYRTNEVSQVMIQFIDVTDGIQFTKSKEQNILLQTVNASVSHELRNPLNSIIAQVRCQKIVIQELNKIFTSNEFKALFSEELKMVYTMIMALMGQLEESTNIADCSSDFMCFMIQDFLDYAQLKNNKFRRNISRFNIRDIVARVINIQRATAKEKKVALLAEFSNIAEKVDEEGPEEA